MKRTRSILLVTCLSVSFIVSSCTQKQNWPQFRGPESNMVSNGKNLPAEWGNDKNIKWKYKLDGAGWSSPIVWGDKVFFVSTFPESVVSEAVPPNGHPMPDPDEEENDTVGPGRTPPAPPRGNGPPPGPNPQGPPPPPENDTAFMKDVYRWDVTCVSLSTGKELWKQVAYKGNPWIKKHSLNSYASETPVTDGKRLYVYFGMTGLFCYDLDGKLLWQKDMGVYKTQNGWGTGSSPVIFEDILYIQNDNEVNSFIVALDAATGAEKWRAPRNEKTTYATPFIWKNKIRNELILLGKTAVSYDLKTGNTLWQMNIGGEQAIPSPVADENRIYMGNPGGREKKSNLYAIKAGAEGDITPKDSLSTNASIDWVVRDAGLGNGSPLLYNGLIYFLSGQGGTFVCLNAENGKQIYKERIKRLGAIWASPWAYEDKICFYDEKGVTRTIKAGEQFALLSENKLKDKFWASVAITDDSYIFKGVEWLYCIKN
jgi:outer membrane protein assembly factor BamB